MPMSKNSNKRSSSGAGAGTSVRIFGVDAAAELLMGVVLLCLLMGDRRAGASLESLA